MAIVINGSGTVTGLAVGGLPDGTVDAGTLATNSVDSAELIDGGIDDSHLVTDGTYSTINLKDVGVITNAIGSIGGGAQTIDLTAGNSVSGTVDTSTTTFTFSNPTASDELCTFSLILTNGGSQTVNFPATVDWAGGTAPTLTTAGVDILVFASIDGGTIWHGFAAALDSKTPS